MEQHFKTNPLILKSLNEKSFLHLDILDKSNKAFQQIKIILKQLQDELKGSGAVKDKRLLAALSLKGDYEAEFKIASDTLVFLFHSNVFIFEQDHALWKTSYFHNDPMNAHCGMISVYNFLSDSFTFSRNNDIGYLITRIFINKDNHFYVEGKRQLGFLYNDFENMVVTPEKLKDFIDTTILFCLDFDMYTPPFDSVNEITVQEVINTNLSSSLATGKRLGFRLQTDADKIE